MILGALAEKGFPVDLVTSKGDGALSDLNQWPNVCFRRYPYRFSNNLVVTMVRYFWVQVYLFFLSWRYFFSRGTVFYVNTILPVGAAIAGRMMGKRVVYHYHENASVKGLFYRVLARMMQSLASEIICVSEYQRSFLKRRKNVVVVPNAVPSGFVSRLCPDSQQAFERKRVLMLGSLKRYKGTLELVELARRMLEYQFELVLNETQENIDVFWNENRIESLANLRVYSRQNDVVPFYNRASLVLNLSNKDLFIETFGLTALEAMSAGLPVIVPTVGGIAEIVEDGVNGYKIDVQELDRIEAGIRRILSEKELYISLSKKALEKSRQFDAKSMIQSIVSCITL